MNDMSIQLQRKKTMEAEKGESYYHHTSSHLSRGEKVVDSAAISGRYEEQKKHYNKSLPFNQSVVADVSAVK